MPNVGNIDDVQQKVQQNITQEVVIHTKKETALHKPNNSGLKKRPTGHNAYLSKYSHNKTA